MIKRFVFGTPFPTESVVLDLPVETGPVPFLTPDGDGWTSSTQASAATTATPSAGRALRRAIFLHEGGRLALRCGSLARQGLLYRFSPPRGSGIVRQAV